jgi:hypothetical protein
VASAVNPNLYQQPPRGRTPPSDEVEHDYSNNRAEEVRQQEPKSKGNKGKNVNWKEKDEGSSKETSGNNSSKDKVPKQQSDANIINESALGLALSKEIKKTEDNLHSRLGRLISKEMEKQREYRRRFGVCFVMKADLVRIDQRLEEARATEQIEDSVRQEKILKLISTELTRNTTRVVELAVKSEVQNSVLPSLENITKHEVRSALNDHVGRGLVDVIAQVRSILFHFSTLPHTPTRTCPSRSRSSSPAPTSPATSPMSSLTTSALSLSVRSKML